MKTGESVSKRVDKENLMKGEAGDYIKKVYELLGGGGGTEKSGGRRVIMEVLSNREKNNLPGNSTPTL